MGTLSVSVPTEHCLTTFWVFLRAALSAHALQWPAACSSAPGVLVGGPGLFSSYSASARATCTPRTAFVSSDLDLVKGYNSGAADTECKVTFTNGLQTRGVGEFGQCASSGDVLSSRFVNGDEIFAVKVAEMAISGPLLAARAPDIMQSMLHFLGSFCASSHALQDLLKDFPSFSSVAPSYSPRFLPSLENKSNKKSNMFKPDVAVFDMLCAPIRELPDPLVIKSDEGHNVSSQIMPISSKKPPENSPGARQGLQTARQV